MEKQAQRIVIKIGSKILTDENGHFNKSVVENLVKDIAYIKEKENLEIALISSGAVALGREIKPLEKFEVETSAIKYNKAILREQILASIGQPRLMAFYCGEFKKHKLACAQLLATRAVFADREAYLSIRTVTESLMKLNVIPIFNENDVLSPEELDFSDNDQLASMVAAMLVADKLIVLSNVDGVYNNLGNGTKRQVISMIEEANNFIKNIDDSKSLGKRGMKSKLIIADLITSLGVDMHIANGSENKVISRIVGGEKLGTFFPAKSKKVKAIKNWLATAAVSRGKIYVSTYLADILKEKQTASILITGVEKIEGKFDKGEVVGIYNENKKLLGRGLARYSSREIEQKIVWYNKKSDNEKAKIKAADIVAVHYDYFSFV
ncbi:glutamate 5-kinase [Candidatus Falkowbacteria bacterium]|nr:glutamate 5-kinase [Candidatus Falkowbacteria bacterium]